MSDTQYTSAPNDSRYIPLSQQPYLCVPTCIQMVMYRNGIPLIPAEEIGYHLGLTVPPNVAKSFYQPRISEEPPVNSGYGTQIQTSQYDPNRAFEELGIPLQFTKKLSSLIKNVDEMMNELLRLEDTDIDVLFCFNAGVLYSGEYRAFTGHVVVFDRIIDGKIRLVDPDATQPKWRTVKASTLFDAIQAHGDENFGGIWYLDLV